MKFVDKFQKLVSMRKMSYTNVADKMLAEWKRAGKVGPRPGALTTVHRWKRGENLPDVNNLKWLARALEVPVGFLADETLKDLEDVPGVGDKDAQRVLEAARRVGLENAAAILAACSGLEFWEAMARLVRQSGKDKEKPPHVGGGSPNHHDGDGVRLKHG